MNKLTLIALLGASNVSAHPRFVQMCQQTATSYGFPEEMNALFGAPQQVFEQCELNDEDYMEDTELLSKLEYNIYNSMTKGWYRTRSNPISEECFGGWMIDQAETISPVVDKLMLGDYFSITKEEATTAATDMVDMIFVNQEACQYERTVNDFMDWCINNANTCVYGEGLFDRLLTNSPTIINKSVDLFNLMIQDDTCYSDVELVEEVSDIVEDISLLFSIIYGFDTKWDISTPVEHKTSEDYMMFSQRVSDNLVVPEVEEPQGCPFEAMMESLDFAQPPQFLVENPPYEGFPGTPPVPQALLDNLPYPEFPEAHVWGEEDEEKINMVLDLLSPPEIEFDNIFEMPSPEYLLENPPYEGYPNFPQFPWDSLIKQFDFFQIAPFFLGPPPALADMDMHHNGPRGGKHDGHHHRQHQDFADLGFIKEQLPKQARDTHHKKPLNALFSGMF